VDPDPLSYIIFFIAASFFSLTVAAEIAFANAGQSHNPEADTSTRAPELVREILERPAHLLITLTLIKSLSVLLLGGMLLSSMLHTETLAVKIGVILVLWIALNIARTSIRSAVVRRPEWIAAQLAPSVWIVMRILQPFSSGLLKLGESIAGRDAHSLNDDLFLMEDGLRRLLDIDNEQNSIQEAEKQMIASILDLGDTTVREVMVPRIDMIALNVETSLQEALHVIVSAGHSRIPVFEGSADRITGLLYAKDLLEYLQDTQGNVPISSLLRPAYFVPASKKIDTLLHELQAQRIHMAIIVDEYGGTAGLVTIEDLLEEIVGEIQDEYDPEEEMLVELIATDTYLFNARVGIDTLAEVIAIDIDEDNVDTLGGLLSLLVGRVPEQGKTVTYKNWQFTILSVDGYRIDKVRVEPDAHVLLEMSDAQDALDGISSSRNSMFNFSVSGK